MAFRSLATSARKTLRIGLIPADGIGREVIPVNAIVQVLFFLLSTALAFSAGRAQNVGSLGIGPAQA